MVGFGRRVTTSSSEHGEDAQRHGRASRRASVVLAQSVYLAQSERDNNGQKSRATPSRAGVHRLPGTRLSCPPRLPRERADSEVLALAPEPARKVASRRVRSSRDERPCTVHSARHTADTTSPPRPPPQSASIAMDRQSVFTLSLFGESKDNDGGESSNKKTQQQLVDFILEFHLENVFIYRYDGPRAELHRQR